MKRAPWLRRLVHHLSCEERHWSLDMYGTGEVTCNDCGFVYGVITADEEPAVKFWQAIDERT